MKTAAAAILALSALALLLFLGRYVVCSVEAPQGMLNPSLDIELPAERQPQLLALIVWLATAAYFYGVVAWAKGRIGELGRRLPEPEPEPAVRQPPEVKRLKDAIRAGDLRAIGKIEDEDALAYMDEHLLSPFELADLYGDERVIEAVGKAYRKQPGGRYGGGPTNRFGISRERYEE